MIDLNPHQLETVKRILAEHLPGCEVRAFGSRATWTAKEHSDLDLVVMSSKPLDWNRQCLVSEAFEESDLPIRVDVVDWESLSDGFRQAINEDCVVVQEGATTSTWRETTLGECARLIRNTVSPADFGDDPYIGLEHIGEGTLSLLDHGVASDVSSAKAQFQEGDILFGKLRPYFRKVIRPRFDGICSTDIWVVRPAEGVDAGWLFYLMASQEFVDHATLGSEGTRMPRAKWEHVRRYPVQLPPLDEQRRIAGILGALDDKIELNRRMCQTLEAMAQALFKSWFVDFDPVRAKANGQPTNLPPEIDVLFPDSFQDSELGEIPEGWDVGQLGDLIEVNPHRAIKRGQPATHVAMAALPTSGGQVSTWTNRPFTSGSRFTRGDTLLARITPSLENGKTALVDFLEEGEVGWGSTEFIVLRPQGPWPREFGYLLAREPRFREHAIVNMTGTSGRQRVPPEALSTFALAVSPVGVAGAFGDLVRPWFDLATTAVEQIRVIAAIRDAHLRSHVGRTYPIRAHGQQEGAT